MRYLTWQRAHFCILLIDTEQMILTPRYIKFVWLCVLLGCCGCSSDCALLCTDDLLTMKACPPSEEEFVDLFQKIKYSLSLLVRLV